MLIKSYKKIKVCIRNEKIIEWNLYFYHSISFYALFASFNVNLNYYNIK